MSCIYCNPFSTPEREAMKCILCRPYSMEEVRKDLEELAKEEADEDKALLAEKFQLSAREIRYNLHLIKKQRNKLMDAYNQLDSMELKLDVQLQLAMERENECN